MSRMRVAPLAALALVLATGFALAGCTGQSTQSSAVATDSPTQVVTSAAPVPVTTPTSTPAATVTPTPTPTPTPTSTLAGPACDALVTPEELYGYDPNYSDVESPKSPATCAWTSGSTASQITLVLGRTTSATYPGTKVPGYSGTFQVASGKGTIHANVGKYAVTLSSATFGTVDDALPFLDLFSDDLD